MEKTSKLVCGVWFSCEHLEASEDMEEWEWEYVVWEAQGWFLEQHCEYWAWQLSTEKEPGPNSGVIVYGRTAEAVVQRALDMGLLKHE